MRKSLETIAQLEQFLEGNMTALEQEIFQTELLTSPSLAEALVIQKVMHQAIQQVHARQLTNKARKTYAIQQMIKWSGLTLLVVIAIALAISSFTSSSTPIDPVSTNQESNGSQEKFGQLNELVYNIDTSEPTVLTTDAGFIFSIGSKSFGEHPNVEIRIKEAVSAAHIIKAALSTVSYKEELETAGMFEFNAYVDGKLVDITQPILVSIGTENDPENMSLYDGVIDSTGSINWVRPKALRNDLPIHPLSDLDFIPQAFDNTFGQLAKSASRNQRDSVYYSVGLSEISRSTASTALEVSEIKSTPLLDSEPANLWLIDSFSNSGEKNKSSSSIGNYIPPIKIKTLYAAKFEKTLISTQAFAERLQYIHTTCDSTLIDLYVQHLDWPIYKIDSLVYSKTKDRRFQEFYEKHQGGVSISTEAAQALQTFYRAQQEVERKALALANEKQKELLRHYQSAAKSLTNTEQLANMQMVQEEWNLLYQEASKQLGYVSRVPNASRVSNNSNAAQNIRVGNSAVNMRNGNRSSFTTAVRSQTISRFPIPRRTMLTASFSNNGWKNFDQALNNSFGNRTTFNFTNSKIGKSAHIAFAPSSVKLSNSGDYDLVRCYFKPIEANSFIKVNGDSSGVFSYSLNSLYKYKVIVVGMKHGQNYYTESPIGSNERLVLTLNEISESQLDQELDKLSPNQASLLTQLHDMIKAEQAYKNARRGLNFTPIEMSTLYRSCFPCITYNAAPYGTK